MFRSFAHFWSKGWLPLTNTFIVVVVALILIDSLPFVPERLRDITDPLVSKTGLGQGQWTMFSPVPDKWNTRMSAEIEYADGTRGAWSSPNWRRLPLWRRFTDSRYREYLDNIPLPVAESAWPALADQIVSETRSDAIHAKPRKVAVWIETATIADPREARWPSMSERVEYTQRRLLYEREYP